MPQSRTLVLNSGGLRSLVATATVASRQRTAMLFAHDGRAASDHLHRAALAQAEHFQYERKLELTMPHLRPPLTGEPRAEPQPYAAMASAQLALAAAGVAVQSKAQRLIWPVQPGGDYEAVAAVTEVLAILEEMLEHQLEAEVRPRIETPLLEMTDRQLIEIGHQMDVPWQLARTCLTSRDDPCHACTGCHRRIAAFEEAGVEDPQASPVM